MPTSLTLDEHLAAIDSSGARLIELAEKSGWESPVATCPAWSAADLVAHQAMVHRWATSHVRGEDPNEVPNQTEIRTMVADLAAFYREGHAGLLAALRAAPADLDAMRFLKDAPAPREFWARRQAHETTIHMVDALAATLGRAPATAEAGIDRALAADGIDELVRGFFTRGKSKLYDGEEYSIAVEATDAGRRWVLRVAERLTVDPGDAPADVEVDARISGPADAVYLALWNRGDEIDVTGRPGLLDQWRSSQRVRWS